MEPDVRDLPGQQSMFPPPITGRDAYAEAESTCNPSVQESDESRLTAARVRVHERLKRGPATNHELKRPDLGGDRFTARLGELRKAGIGWTKRQIDQSTYEYRLI